MNSSEQTIQRHSVITHDEKLNLTQIFALIFAFGALMSMGWLDNARGPLFPMILKDLDLSHSQGSLFFASASFTAILANVLVPLQIRRFGSQKILFLGVMILSFFPLLMSWSSTYSLLLISAVVFGWAMGTIGVTQNIVVEESVPAHRRRTYLSLLHSVYGLSALLAPFLIGQILARGYLWSQSLIFILLFIAPVLLFGVLSLKSTPNVIIEDQTQPKKMDIKLVLFWGTLLAFYVSCELFFSTRIVVLFHHVFNKSFHEANFQLILFFLGLFLGRILVSFLPHRFSSRRVIEICLFCTLVFIILGLYVSENLFFILGFTLAPIFPLCMDEISNQTGIQFKQYSSIVIAISSVGVVIMHLLTGVVADHFGLLWSISLPLICVSLALLGSIVLFPKK